MRAKEQAKKTKSCENCQLQSSPYCGECYGFDKFVSKLKTMETFLTDSDTRLSSSVPHR